MEQSVAGVAKTTSITAIAGSKGSGSIGAKLGATNKRLAEKEKDQKESSTQSDTTGRK